MDVSALPDGVRAVDALMLVPPGGNHDNERRRAHDVPPVWYGVCGRHSAPLLRVEREAEVSDNLDLAELRRLLEAASCGPWIARNQRVLIDNPDIDFSQVAVCKSEVPYTGMHCEDASLIAAMRNALPALLDEIERLRNRIAVVRRIIKPASDYQFLIDMLDGKEQP